MLVMKQIRQTLLLLFILSATTREVFKDETGNGFDYVVNFAAETKFGQSDPVSNNVFKKHE